MKHDFEAAIKQLNDSHNWDALVFHYPTHTDAVLFALRLAQRLMQEPSEKMLQEITVTFPALAIYEHMRDQLIKEVEGGV